MDLAARLAPNIDDDFCYVTTRGRVTRRPHEIEIWFALDGTTLYVLSGGGDRSEWVRNLVTDPTVAVRVGDATYGATARVVEPDTNEDARARTLVYDKYASGGHGDLTSWRAHALPVALDVTAVRPQS